MSQIISASIDLNKIDKSRIIPGKTGGKYYNIQIFVNDEKDKYGNDVSVAEAQTKEEYTRKDKKKYLGNGRLTYTGTPKAKTSETVPQNNPCDDLPF